jgi:hypothetical protein
VACLPNGPASTGCSDFQGISSSFEPSLRRLRSPLPGNGISWPEKNAPIRRPNTDQRSQRPSGRTRSPPIRGLCKHSQEFSANGELRGGPGRSRNFAGRQRLTERCGRLGCFEAKKIFLFVPAPYDQGDAAKRARCSRYSTGFIATNPPHRGRERRTPPRDLQAGHLTAPACAVEVDVKDRHRGPHR